MVRSLWIVIVGTLCFASQALGAEAQPSPATAHPRLYFTAEELKGLRAARAKGTHAAIWKNIAASADWCLTRKLRTEWIAPVTPDPIYLNLYDRFYAMMHDMAVMEHLAFAYAYSGELRYFEGGRQWALACGSIWKREADGEPDQNKAYAALRLLKGLAVSYDLLFDRLSEADRRQLRAAMVEIGHKYYAWYLKNPTMAAEGQDKHHGSVEAASMGVAALALLGEEPEAKDWLDLMLRKHTEYLLPKALTESGTQEQSSNYWASTMQYRLFFMDALRRVTGRDLFQTFKPYMDARIALAAVAGRKRVGHDEEQQCLLFAPSYGQLNYWSPVLLYLAREYRRPIYQHLALWDSTLGSIQKTRYVTTNGEMLLFTLGAYAYAWYDPTVKVKIEPNLPLAFLFSDVNEAYVRASYQEGALVAAMRRGLVIVHAGGRPVLVEGYNLHTQPEPVKALALTEERGVSRIRCEGQTLELKRPGTLTLHRKAMGDIQWWCADLPVREQNTLLWKDGTRLTIKRGTLVSLEPEGFRDEKIVGLGKLKLIDPMPTKYPLLTARPTDGEIVIEIVTPGRVTADRREKGN